MSSSGDVEGATNTQPAFAATGQQAQAGLVIDGVSVNYGSMRTLDNVSFEVSHGEIVTIVGTSGCGKTTLLNVVAGLLQPSTGSVSVAGSSISGPGPDRAMVFQEDAVFPWMTVRDNAAYALRLKKIPKARRYATVQPLLDELGLGDRGDAYPRQLSGGLRKRVDLARALASHPEVLLMDEPYAALDQMTKGRLQIEFMRIAKENSVTSLFVTHDLEEAVFVADRVIVMAANPGRIVEICHIPFPYPRHQDLKPEPEFQEIRRKLMNLIHGSGD